MTNTKKSFCTIKTAKAGCYFHNSREKEASYLIEGEFAWCDKTHTEAYKLEQSLNKKAKDNYLKKTGRKMRKGVESKIEMVIRVDENKSPDEIMQQLEKVKAYFADFPTADKDGRITNRLQLEPIQTAIHLDEGHQNHEHENCLNAHAHIVFSNFDQNGNTIKRQITHSDLVRIQTQVAKIMQFERGQFKSPHKHLHHTAYRDKANKEKELVTERQQIRSQSQELARKIKEAEQREAMARQAQEKANIEKLEAQRLQDHAKSQQSLWQEIRTTKSRLEKLKKQTKEAQKALTATEKTLDKNNDFINEVNAKYQANEQFKKEAEKEYADYQETRRLGGEQEKHLLKMQMQNAEMRKTIDEKVARIQEYQKTLDELESKIEQKRSKTAQNTFRR